MLIEDAIKEYLVYCSSIQLRGTTSAAYHQALRLFSIWLNRERHVECVQDLTVAHVREYTLWLKTRSKYETNTGLLAAPVRKAHHTQSISDTTINNYLRYLRSFMNWMVEEQMTPISPMRKTRLIPDRRNAKNYLENEEILRLVLSMNRDKYQEYRDMIAMLIMLDSGTRIGETLSIEEDQINLDERLLRLPPQKTKSRKERTVFFSSHTANEVRDWMTYKSKIIDTPLLFPLKGKPIAVKPQVYEANFQGYLKRVGISQKITPHTLRNNFAKRCLLSGMDIYTLSRLLGHSSVTITERAYLDITQKNLQEKYQGHSPISSIFHDESRNQGDRNSP